MTTYNFTIGSAADKANGLCQHTSLDLWRMQRAGLITAGSTVNGVWRPGTLTGRDCCVPVRNFDLFMTAPDGDVIFDCTPIAPNTASTLFPNDADYNASWLAKAPVIVWDGNLDGGPGFHIQNATYGTSYGNIAGIRKNSSSSVNGGISEGGIYLDDWEISGCDNGILATAKGVAGDAVVIKNSNIHDNGAGDGQSHNIYLDHFDLFLFLNSTSIDCNVGQDIKSLARMNIIGWSVARDTNVPARAASYAMDMNGGIWLVYHSDIGQELNDSNASVMTNFQTDRQGQGPHEVFLLGNTWYSADHYRGYFFKMTNRYLDPTQDYHHAPQLGWNDVRVCIDGNDFQYVDQDLDYGSRGTAALIPVNSGITLLSDINADNRLIATTDPSAGTPYANVDPAKLALSSVGDIVAGKGYADFDDATVTALIARSIALQSGVTPPPDDTPPVIPDPPPAPPPTTGKQVRIIRSSEDFTVPSGTITNLKFHIWGGGQAGEAGQYATTPVAGGKGGKSSGYAQYAPGTLPAGTVCTFTKGVGGVTSLQAGGNSSLVISAVTVARAIGGDNTGTPAGTLTYDGSAGGDPNANSAPPPDTYLPSQYGMGGAGAPGPHGLGGKGADQANHQPEAPPSGGFFPNTYFYGNWWLVEDVTIVISEDPYETASNPPELIGLWAQVESHIVGGVLDNGGSDVAYSGGGNADAGFDNGIAWVDAPEYTDIPTNRWVGNGGGVNAGRDLFFTVHGNVPNNPHSGASAGQGNAPRDDVSVNAYGGDGLQFAAKPSIGTVDPGGALVIGVDTSLLTTDQAGPGTGAAGIGGGLFSRPYEFDPGGPFDFSGFRGGDFGAGGSGAPSIWDFGSNGFGALYTLNGGPGGDGGMIVEWGDDAEVGNGRRWLNVSGPIYT